MKNLFRDAFGAAAVMAFILMFYVGGQFESGRIGAVSFIVRFIVLCAGFIYSCINAGACVREEDASDDE